MRCCRRMHHRRLMRIFVVVATSIRSNLANVTAVGTEAGSKCVPEIMRETRPNQPEFPVITNFEAGKNSLMGLNVHSYLPRYVQPGYGIASRIPCDFKKFRFTTFPGYNELFVSPK